MLLIAQATVSSDPERTITMSMRKSSSDADQDMFWKARKT